MGSFRSKAFSSALHPAAPLRQPPTRRTLTKYFKYNTYADSPIVRTEPVSPFRVREKWLRFGSLFLPQQHGGPSAALADHCSATDPALPHLPP